MDHRYADVGLFSCLSLRCLYSIPWYKHAPHNYTSRTNIYHHTNIGSLRYSYPYKHVHTQEDNKTTIAGVSW